MRQENTILDLLVTNFWEPTCLLAEAVGQNEHLFFYCP